jgi:hypothetical protein
MPQSSNVKKLNAFAVKQSKVLHEDLSYVKRTGWFVNKGSESAVGSNRSRFKSYYSKGLVRVAERGKKTFLLTDKGEHALSESKKVIERSKRGGR